ncbi:hypothetical protein AC628_24585 [Bradyrhizobium sp. NAS96.2]|nr:hypothetical protein AC628_24585 [Bradyrhizobium sp. NAS96.2]
MRNPCQLGHAAAIGLAMLGHYSGSIWREAHICVRRALRSIAARRPMPDADGASIEQVLPGT